MHTASSRRVTVTMMVAGLVVTGYAISGVARANAASTISGVAFYDDNRDGVLDGTEQPISGQLIYLMDSTESTFIASATTDASGAYSFTAVPDGSYTVEVAPSSWMSIRDSYVPTTTSSVWPKRQVSISGNSASVGFGWRPIVTSTTLGSPISRYQGPTGLTVESYNDALDAQALYSDLVSSGSIGAEAPYVLVRFGYGSQNITSSVWQLDNGTYSNYRATSYSTYDAWLDGGDATMFHEYGHAWSMYYATIVQGDPNLTGYLQARGLANDSRVDSTYVWQRQEMIAEDFRQLFGTPNAAARAQANTDTPPAGSVSGLRDYLWTTFKTPPAGTAPAPAPSPTPLSISGVVMSPTPVQTSGTLSFALSAAATVNIVIKNSSGTIVRNLLTSAPEPTGTSQVTWNRLDNKGRKVRTGTYSAVVSATNSTGSATGSVTFSTS